MSGYGEVFWGIVSAFLAFLLGLAGRRILQLLTNYRARRFWRPLVGEDMSVVIGRFREIPGFEVSGVVGAGDNIALKDLADFFAGIGFKRFAVFYSDQFGGTDLSGGPSLQGNLILLGGPDTNSVTRDVLERLTLGIEFLEVTRRNLARIQRDGALLPQSRATRGRRRLARRRRRGSEWRVPVFLDHGSGKVHGPVFDGERLTSDCGAFIRCPNPFNSSREVMIFCGSYGYGTWAAVRYVLSAEFLERTPPRAASLECILRVDVVRDIPQAVDVEVMRLLTDVARGPDVATVPRIVE